MFCTKADISWNTCSSSLLSRSGLVDHGVHYSLDPSFTIFQPCFWLWKWLECDTCTFVRVSFIWLTLAIATIPFSWFLFCHVEHCQRTTCSVWHEGLPDHFRPCQNTWVPHYAAACDWLKSKGVSALTDRSGVVYWFYGCHTNFICNAESQRSLPPLFPSCPPLWCVCVFCFPPPLIPPSPFPSSLFPSPFITTPSFLWVPPPPPPEKCSSVG